MELCSVTSLTPSIRRRRSIVNATAAWLVVQPASVNVGTLPGGVAELTDEPDAALELELVEPDAEPTVPSSEVSETFDGSTRPNSWNACAQLKRELTSVSTAWTRCSRIATKLVYGASAAARAWACCACAVSVATWALRLEI